MKKTFLFGITLTLLLTAMSSCDMLNLFQTPLANFSASDSITIIGEEISFTNLSEDAETYLWEFGDGDTSEEFSPTHTYEDEGTYKVVLTAFNGKKEDSKDKSIEVKSPPPTQLEINVYYDDDPNTPVPNCNIDLYLTEADWDNFENIILEVKTNSLGYVLISDLSSIVYYIDAWKQYDQGYLVNWFTEYKTTPLIANTVNSYNIYLEYYEPTKKGLARNESFRVKRIELKDNK